MIQAAVWLLVIIGIVYASIMRSPLRNLAAIEKWFKSMDVVVNGKRFRGSRSTPVFTLDHGPHGLFGYQIESICRTQSGRVFEIRVKATLGRVVDWTLTPQDPAVLAAMEEEERLELEQARERALAVNPTGSGTAVGGELPRRDSSHDEEPKG